MSESYTQTTTKSWGQRIKEALTGLIVGPIFIFVSTVTLWNNEGRSAHMIAGLAEGKSIVQEANPLAIDEKAHGGLIHITAEAQSDEILSDADFSLSTPGIALERKVEMYQWTETSSSSSHDNYGGSQTTTTTYTYDMRWSDAKIDSSRFNISTGHENPQVWKYDQKSLRPKAVKVGSYVLTSPMISLIDAYTVLPLSADSIKLNANETLVSNTIYVGKDSLTPAIGDLRVSYMYTPNNYTLSILGKQEAPNLLTSYIAKSKSDISRIQSGTHSSDEMFLAAEQENTLITWIYRAVGLLFLFIGFSLFFRILPILLKFLPPLAWLADIGVGLLAFVLTLIVGGGTIALAWVFYRPLISIIILAIIGGIGYLAYRHYKKTAPNPSTGGVAPAPTPTHVSTNDAYLSQSISSPPKMDDQNFLSASSLPDAVPETPVSLPGAVPTPPSSPTPPANNFL